MKYINSQNLPEPYVKAVENDDYSAGESDYTPTSLIRPPYMTKLRGDHWDGIEVDVADRFFAMFGKLAHAFLAAADPKPEHAGVERRIYAQYGNFIISMQMDRLAVSRHVLQDWKVTTVYKFMVNYDGTMPAEPGWETQLNIGKWVLERKFWYYNLLMDGKTRIEGSPYEVKKLEVIGLLRDHHLTNALRDKNYPQHPVIRRELPIWDKEKVEGYLDQRIEQHEFAKTNPIADIPPCTEEERWDKPFKFALMKKGNKRAVKLFDTKSGPESYADGKGYLLNGPYSIQERPGERTRCDRYCDVNSWCPCYQEWLKSQDKE